MFHLINSSTRHLIALSFAIFIFITSFAQTSSCLDILPNPDVSSPAFQEFDRYIQVLGVLKFYAEPGVSDAKLIHAASIGAELLDNDEDGLIDDVELGEQLSLVNSIMPLFLEEGSPAEEAMMENFDETFCVHAVLYSEEIAPEAPLDWFSEASLEEILHTINGCGHVELYPSMFALWPAGASQLTQAMDLARGGQFLAVPGSYPEEAWFHYTDVTCDYECMAIEYLYWSIATNMGVLDTPEICEAIEEEWEPCSPELLETTDPMVYWIITNPNNKLPQQAPNGIYCPIVSVSETTLKVQPNVYPNPSNNQIAIDLNSLSSNAKICVITEASGREVFSYEINSASQSVLLDVDLVSGIYFLSIYSKTEAFLYSTTILIN
jgi:hypothetical protein